MVVVGELTLRHCAHFGSQRATSRLPFHARVHVRWSVQLLLLLLLLLSLVVRVHVRGRERCAAVRPPALVFHTSAQALLIWIIWKSDSDMESAASVCGSLIELR